MKPSKQKHNLIWTIVPTLLLVYIYIFWIFLNYDFAWMNLEKIKTHLWILGNGPAWQWEDFSKFLNTKIIEVDPNRLTRPLSNLIEVIDTKLRANCWNFIPPHPSLSLQWPFLFIGLPIFLFRFLKNIGCQSTIALAGVCLYLTSPGFLSPICMLSHPGKNMVNFFSILALATISQLYRHAGETKNISIKDIPHFWRILISTLLWTIITFLSDETGLFLLPVLIIVTYPLIRKLKEKIILCSSLFLLPVLYFIIIKFLLPWLHSTVNHETIALSNYRDYPQISKLFLPNWHDLFTNAYLLFSDHPNLKWNFSPLLQHPFVLSLQCLYTLAFILLSGLFITTLCKTKKPSLRVKQILIGLGFLICYIYFHTFQLSHNVRTWCLFWYGCPFSLIYYVTLALILQFVWEEFKGLTFKIILPFLILIFALEGLVGTTYRINIFKDQGIDARQFAYPDILSGKINHYQYFNLSKNLQTSRCRYLYTLFYWAKTKQKNINFEPFAAEIQSCRSIINADPYSGVEQVYFIIETAFEFPVGHSFLNNPSFISAVTHQEGEPL